MNTGGIQKLNMTSEIERGMMMGSDDCELRGRKGEGKKK